MAIEAELVVLVGAIGVPHVTVTDLTVRVHVAYFRRMLYMPSGNANLLSVNVIDEPELTLVATTTDPASAVDKVTV